MVISSDKSIMELIKFPGISIYLMVSNTNSKLLGH